jgi:hypothetical protein
MLSGFKWVNTSLKYKEKTEYFSFYELVHNDLKELGRVIGWALAVRERAKGISELLGRSCLVESFVSEPL